MAAVRRSRLPRSVSERRDLMFAVWGMERRKKGAICVFEFLLYQWVTVLKALLPRPSQSKARLCISAEWATSYSQ